MFTLSSRSRDHCHQPTNHHLPILCALLGIILLAGRLRNCALFVALFGFASYLLLCLFYPPVMTTTMMMPPPPMTTTTPQNDYDATTNNDIDTGCYYCSHHRRRQKKRKSEVRRGNCDMCSNYCNNDNDNDEVGKCRCSVHPPKQKRWHLCVWWHLLVLHGPRNFPTRKN